MKEWKRERKKKGKGWKSKVKNKARERDIHMLTPVHNYP